MHWTQLATPAVLQILITLRIEDHSIGGTATGSGIFDRIAFFLRIIGIGTIQKALVGFIPTGTW